MGSIGESPSIALLLIAALLATGCGSTVRLGTRPCSESNPCPAGLDCLALTRVVEPDGGCGGDGATVCTKQCASDETCKGLAPGSICTPDCRLGGLCIGPALER